MKWMLLLFLLIGCATRPTQSEIDALRTEAAEGRGALHSEIVTVTLEVKASQDGLTEIEKDLSAAVSNLEKSDASLAEAVNKARASDRDRQARVASRLDKAIQGVADRGEDTSRIVFERGGERVGEDRILSNALQSLKDKVDNHEDRWQDNEIQKVKILGELDAKAARNDERLKAIEARATEAKKQTERVKEQTEQVGVKTQEVETEQEKQDKKIDKVAEAIATIVKVLGGGTVVTILGGGYLFRKKIPFVKKAFEDKPKGGETR